MVPEGKQAGSCSDDLNRLIQIEKPNTRVYYDLQEIGDPNLGEVINDFVEKYNLKK